MERYIFLLFGEQLVNTYENDGIDSLVNEIKIFGKIDNGMLFVFDRQEDHPEDLLFNFNGWTKFVVIERKEYLKLLEASGELRTFVFESKITIKAKTEDEAIRLFADSSHDFAPNADRYETF